MVSPLAQMNIGSPLLDSGDAICKQILAKEIEIPQNLWHLHTNSRVEIRAVKDLGVDMLQGSWLYTPRYIDKKQNAISYSIGHIEQPTDNQRGMVSLMNLLANKAEQDLYYSPLRVLRKFLINHDRVSGSTDFRLPESWSLIIDESLSVHHVMGVIEGYVNGEQRTKIGGAVYEALGCVVDNNTTPFALRLLCVQGDVYTLPIEHPVQGPKLFDLTPLVRFIHHPIDHGLTLEVLNEYRSLVNL